MTEFKPGSVRTMIALGVAAALTLVAYGYVEHPRASLLSAAAASVILIAYAVFGSMLKRPRWSAVVGLGSMAGFSAGAAFAGEILLEYIYRPSNNVIWGHVEFGTVFLIYALAAEWAAWLGRPIREAVSVAFVAAVISSLIWCVILLSVFYAYEGTAAQTAVLIAEGERQDFLRSGMKDYRTFLIEDLFGAVFFHLLLGPIIAAILGVFSSSLIVGLRQIITLKA